MRGSISLDGKFIEWSPRPYSAEDRPLMSKYIPRPPHPLMRVYNPHDEINLDYGSPELLHR